jgi:hypothetical protein
MVRHELILSPSPGESVVDTIIVQPRYPNDPLPAVMATFVRAISEATTDCDVVTVLHEPHGHQISPHEMICVWVPAAINTAVGIATIVDKVRTWLKARHQEDAGRRSRSVKLYGPDGRLLKVLSVKKGVDSCAEEVDGNSSDLVRLPPQRR